MSKPPCKVKEKYGCPRWQAKLCGASQAEVAEHAEKKAEKEKPDEPKR